jgi:hypothetical protein
MASPGETVEAAASEFLSSPSDEKTAELTPPIVAVTAENSPPDDCAATSDFPTPAARQPTAYVEPSSDPLAPTIAATDIPILATEPETAKPASRFVAVRKEELGRFEVEEPHQAWISLNTVVLIAALLMVGGGMWYFLQPPSADGLYNRIMGHVGDESLESIKTAEDDIQFFLDQFSNDSRAKKIRGYQREIELDRQERKLLRSESRTLLERAYLDALSYSQSEPEKCAVKLQAVIDLYAPQSDEFLPMGSCIELARRHLKQLQEEMAAYAAEQLPYLQTRLELIDAVKTTDPQRAEAMYRAIVELYSAKSWAAPAVQRAKAALKEGENSDKIEK